MNVNSLFTIDLNPRSYSDKTVIEQIFLQCIYASLLTTTINTTPV